jgi:hypothetical protein
VEVVETEMVCVLAANPTSIVVCGTVTAQFVVGPVGVLLLLQDHITSGNSARTNHLFMDRA